VKKKIYTEFVSKFFLVIAIIFTIIFVGMILIEEFFGVSMEFIQIIPCPPCPPDTACPLSLCQVDINLFHYAIPVTIGSWILYFILVALKK